eukprot:750926-Pelagomonas_calceolata.AAC.2
MALDTAGLSKLFVWEASQSFRIGGALGGPGQPGLNLTRQTKGLIPHNWGFANKHSKSFKRNGADIPFDSWNIHQLYEASLHCCLPVNGSQTQGGAWKQHGLPEASGPRPLCLSHSQHCNASLPTLPPAATAPPPPPPPPPAMASQGQKPSLPHVLHELEHTCDGIWPPLLSVRRLHTWPPYTLRLPRVLPNVGDASMKDTLTELACWHQCSTTLLLSLLLCPRQNQWNIVPLKPSLV